MKLSKLAGATSEIWQVFIRDSSSTTGGGLTGLAFNSGSLTAYYHRDTDTTATAITLATMTVGTFTSSGFKEIDATNMPGWYQFCPPNAALASGAKSCGFHLKGVTNMAPLPIEVQLQSFNVDDAVRGGLTALPNANAEAAGGLYTRGTGAGQIKQTNNGEIDANATHVNNVATTSVTTINANVGTTQPTNFTGTGGSALVQTDVVDWKGSAAAAMTGDAYARLGAPAGASVSADVAAVKVDTAAIKAKTDNLPASPAAVGSAMTLSAAYDFAKGTTAVTESYAANGVAPTPVQALMAIHQMLMDFGISGANLTVKKLDNSTTAFVVGLDSSSAPTAASRT